MQKSNIVWLWTHIISFYIYLANGMLGHSFRRVVYSSRPHIRQSKLLLTTNIVVVGKKNSVEPWIVDGISEYEKRLRPIMNLNTIYTKNDEELINCCQSMKGTIIALDEKGKIYTSKEFSDYYYKSLELGGATCTFVIGAFDGLPPAIRDKYPLISLSKMTWTHQMARLLLIEQIYRAAEIRKGSGYHKE